MPTITPQHDLQHEIDWADIVSGESLFFSPGDYMLAETIYCSRRFGDLTLPQMEKFNRRLAEKLQQINLAGWPSTTTTENVK